MTAPVVSVCLPVYNGEKFLPEAIESVLSQTFKDFELIAVDDVSSDRSAEIIAGYAAQDKRVKLHRNETNLGLFPNYNKCMELSVGRYIKPFAQDDFWQVNLLERMAKQLDARPKVALVACAREWVDAQGQNRSVERTYDEDREIMGDEAAFEMLSKIVNFVGEPCAVMYRSETKGSGFSPDFPQVGDLEYWARILQQGDLFYISEALCKYRVHGANQTHKNIASLDYYADLIAIRDKYHQFFAGKGLSYEEFTQCILQKAVDLTNYAKSVGIDFSQSELKAMQHRNKELGRLLVDVLQRLAAIEPEYASAMARLQVVEDESAKLHGEMNNLLNSPSWKVTAGLRGIKKMTSSLFHS